jgi:hypothetical protein
MHSFSLTFRIVMTICYLAVLALLSLIPGPDKPGDSAFIWLVANTPTLIQKILHVCLYGVLTLLLAWTLDGVGSKTYRFLIALIIAVSFGALMEWCQTKVPGRYATLYDVGLNAAGAVIGLLFAVFLL